MAQNNRSGLDVAGRFNSHRRAAQRLTLHCGTGVLGYYREASSAGALQSETFGPGPARQMSLKRKSHTSRLQTMVGYVATARNAVPVSILPLLPTKRLLRIPPLLHPTPSLILEAPGRRTQTGPLSWAPVRVFSLDAWLRPRPRDLFVSTSAPRSRFP